MATFFYEAIQSDGHVVSDTHVASTVQEVESWLAGQGRHPVVIRIADAEGKEEVRGAAAPNFWQRLFGIGINDKILFCRQMATMLGAGVTILQSLQIMGMNKELEANNDFLASLSMKISRYISPQIYKSIFSGQKDVTIHT